MSEEKPPEQPKIGLVQLIHDANQFLDSPVGRTVTKMAGIDTSKTDKEVTKKAFGRFMYAMRDFIQGTWYVFVLFIFASGIAVILLLWLRKVLGV